MSFQASAPPYSPDSPSQRAPTPPPYNLACYEDTRRSNCSHPTNRALKYLLLLVCLCGIGLFIYYFLICDQESVLICPSNCTSAPQCCGMHGACEPTSGMCLCDTDWFGTECDEFNCQNLYCEHGTCNPSSGTCKCSAGKA